MVFDIIFLLIFAWAAYKGYTKGLIVQLATLVALVLGIFGAMKFSSLTANFLVEKFELETNFIHIISLIVTFVIIVIAVHFLAKLIQKLFEAIALGFVNRLLGSVFNIIKYAVILSVILVILNSVNGHYNFLPEKEVSNSKIYKPLVFLSQTLFPKFQQNLRDGFSSPTQTQGLTA